MKIHTIIITYNGMKWIDHCIESLINSTVKTDVIIIDNNSNDGTGFYIQKHFPFVQLVLSKVNLGFGKGNNLGIKMAIGQNADFVFLLNQDAWVQDRTIENLMDLGLEKKYGIISPMHLDPKTKLLENHFSSYINHSSCNGYIQDLYSGSIKKSYEVDFVNAAAWFIPLSTLKKVGGFDPIFPHYTEDIDYINRCNFHELSIAICPNSIIWHDTKAYNWNDVKYNLQIRLNFQILELKKLNHSFTGALLLTFKRNFDENITHLLFRKWKDLLFNLKVQFLALKEIKKIYRSRKITKKYSAYL